MEFPIIDYLYEYNYTLLVPESSILVIISMYSTCNVVGLQYSYCTIPVSDSQYAIQYNVDYARRRRCAQCTTYAQPCAMCTADKVRYIKPGKRPQRYVMARSCCWKRCRLSMVTQSSSVLIHDRLDEVKSLSERRVLVCALSRVNW